MSERRIGTHGVLRKLAEGGGYVMWRYPGCIPGVMTMAEWEALPLAPPKLRQPTPTKEPNHG